MTPDKKVGEIKMEIMTKKVHEWLGSDGNAVTFDSLSCANYMVDTLTKYHQDLMSEVVWNMGAKIEEANFAQKVAERTGDSTAVYEVQEVVRQIQTIIKSLSK